MFDCDYVPVWHAAANRTGKPTHVAELVRDVTSEAGMSDQLDLLRSILQQSTDALYVMRPDQQSRFVYVNQAAERHYGRPAADLLTLRATDLDPQWTLADFDDHQHFVELGDLFRCAHHDRDATRAKHDLRAGGDEPPVVPDAHDDEPQLVVQRQLPDGLVLEGRTRHGKLGELQTIMDRLIANPSPRGFVSALIRGFNPRVQFGTDDTNLTVDVQADSDFCFFGVRAHFQRTALESRSTEATGSVEGAMLIGPSALAMRQLALRAGPGLTRVLMRAIPGIAPSATSLASSSFFATWAGPIGWAIPISYGLRDATMAYTDHLRQLGEDRGQANQWAAAFVREAYGHPHDHYIGTNATVARRGIAAARALAERHGWVHVQSRLEKDYHGGRPPRALSAATGRYDHRELEVIAFRFGEAIFRQRRHGGRIPETLERF